MLRSILPCLVLLVAPLCAVSADAPPKELDLYFAVLIDGQKIGWLHTTQKNRGQEVVTTEEMTMTIARGDIAITIKQKQEFVETRQGKPKSFFTRMEQGLGQNVMGQDVRGTIAPDGGMTVEMSATGRQTTRKLVYPKGALMSYGLSLLSEKHRKKGSKEYTALTFDTSTQLAMTTTVRRKGPTTIKWFGQQLNVSREDATLTTKTGASMTAQGYLDAQGNPIRTILPMGSMNIEMLRCDRAYALSPVKNVINFMDKLLVASPKALAKDATAAEYILKPKAQGAKLAIPNRPGQQVSAMDDGTVRVRVRRQNRVVRKPLSPNKEELAEALKPSAQVESDAKEVRELAAKAVGKETDSFKRALRLEKFVSTYVTGKTLSVASGTALQTLKSRQGDCTEHAALLAGLMRAAGIPARIVCGLAYAPEWASRKNVFVPHAWVEANIAGHWIPYDAALLRHREPGAGRIVLSIGETEGLMDLAGSLGSFTIQSVKVEK